MEELLREAGLTLVDAEKIFNLSSINLKCNQYYRDIFALINKYKYKKPSSFFERFKSAMFEDTEDEVNASRELADNTYLLKNCIKCKCANCIYISDKCVCKSCVYGSYVVECDQIERTHHTDPDVVHLDGYDDIKLVVDIESGKVRATASDVYGIERPVKI